VHTRCLEQEEDDLGKAPNKEQTKSNEAWRSEQRTAYLPHYCDLPVTGTPPRPLAVRGGHEGTVSPQQGDALMPIPGPAGRAGAPTTASSRGRSAEPCGIFPRTRVLPLPPPRAPARGAADRNLNLVADNDLQPLLPLINPTPSPLPIPCVAGAWRRPAVPPCSPSPPLPASQPQLEARVVAVGRWRREPRRERP